MKKAISCFVVMCFSMACPGMAVLPAALAAELTDNETCRQIDADTLRDILQRLKVNLTEGTSTKNEILYLEEIRGTITEQNSKAEIMADEIRASLPETYDFDISFEQSIMPLRRINMCIGNIIDGDLSIENIDNILFLIETISPDMQGEPLATKPELPNRTADTKANVFKKRPIKATGAPVTEADLAETAEIVFTDAIIAKAAELNHDVVDIFTWVKFNIDYEPYYGSMKGSNETLVDMAGNDCDTSSLLLALLRTSDIPSRYVRGDVELKIEDLMNWTGGKTPEAAIAIMQSNKIPTEVICKFDNPEGVIFDHIWVEAFDGHNWRIMDPSFKAYVYTEGIPVDIDVTITNSLIETAVIREGNTISIDQEAINSFLQNLPEVTDEVLSKREIFISEKNNLPPYLARGIIGDRKPAEEFAEMPEDMRVKFRVIMPGGNEYSAPLSEIAGKRVSLVYVGAYPGHQAYIDSVGGIYNLRHPYTGAIVMKPVLQINGETVSEGTFIGLGRGQSLQIGFLRPGVYDPLNPVWEVTNKPLLSGNRYNIFITTQKTSTDELIRLGDEAKEKVIGLPAEDCLDNDMIDEKLRLSGMLYFSVISELSDQVSAVVDVVSVNHISLGYICDEIKPVWEYFLWWPLYVKRIDKSGSHIDVVRSVSCPTSTTGSRADEVTWMKMVGIISTNMEHAMIELVNEVEAVSAGKIFYEASGQGIVIHAINNIETLEADLSKISAHSVVKNHIRAYVSAGYTAMIPQRAVTVGDWYGQGWIVMDEETGAAGYMICGGLHGKTIMVNGGSGTTIVDNPLSTFMAFLYKLVPGMSCLSIACCIIEVLSVFINMPPLLFFGGVVLGAMFMVLGLYLIIKAISIPPVSRIRRRREYAYA